MITPDQMVLIIEAALAEHEGRGKGSYSTRKALKIAAEKIAALTGDNGATVAAAQLENEVTSTLVDMTIATVLATLLEEEGGGRANVSISPLSMDHMMKNYTYDVRIDGLIRHVTIALRPESDLNNEEAWRSPSNRHGVMHQDEDPTGAKPQAEPKEHDRPIWAVSYFRPGDAGQTLLRCNDRADAERQLRSLDQGLLPVLQNRCCLHPNCPSSACMEEVTSGEKSSE